MPPAYSGAANVWGDKGPTGWGGERPVHRQEKQTLTPLVCLGSSVDLVENVEIQVAIRLRDLNIRPLR